MTWKKSVFIFTILIAFPFLFSCNLKEKSDIYESISVDLNQDQRLKLFRHDNFLDLGGADCDFFGHLKAYEKPYADLMIQLKQQQWKYDFISVEYDDDCLNDSVFKAFQELNEDVFGKDLKSVKLEDPIIVIELR